MSASATPSASFTPGPWLLQETVLGICRLIVTVEDVKALKVYPTHNDSRAIAYVPTDDDEEEQAANAHLIAAAPRMYQALLVARSRMESLGERQHPACGCSYCVVAAAIAEAAESKS